MKGFLLAAGHGTRLRPYTDSTPKCLLPIGGVPMLDIWLSLCHRHGISDILVNTHAHAAAVAEFVSHFKKRIHITLREEPKLFGSAGTLLANREWLAGDDRFWVFYADVLTNADLRPMLDFHRSRDAATLGVCSVPDPHRCGIVSVDEKQVVVDFVEKPANPTSTLAFAGIMIGTQQLMDAIPCKPECDIAIDVLPRLVGNMRAYPITDFLLDIGTLENYETAQKTWPQPTKPRSYGAQSD
jgi:mannose-1-phosphate guanylyltransferase